MSDESLSKNQVTSLLQAMSCDERTPELGLPAGNEVSEQISEVDFRRHQHLCRDQLHNLTLMHEAAAKGFASTLGAMLRCPVECALENIATMQFGDFVHSLSDPGCLCQLELGSDSDAGHWLLSVDPTIVFATIDRLLGGEPNPSEVIQRELTDIELRLIRRVINDFLAHLTTAWSKVASLAPAIESISSHPRQSNLQSVNDPIQSIDFQMSLCNVRGRMRLALPQSTLVPIQSQLATCDWTETQVVPSDATRSQISGQLASAPIDVVVNVAHSSIRTEDLLALSVGDVIATEKDVSEPLELAIQDVPKFHAKAGAFKGKKAVQIETIVDHGTQK